MATKKQQYNRAHRRMVHVGLKCPGMHLRRGYRGTLNWDADWEESHCQYGHDVQRPIPSSELNRVYALWEEMLAEWDYEDRECWYWQQGIVPCVSSDAYQAYRNNYGMYMPEGEL